MPDNKKDFITGKNNVVYVYMIFVTPYGKGYGCFAIKKSDIPDYYFIGASFYNPEDELKFNKTKARVDALDRANSQPFDKKIFLDRKTEKTTISFVQKILSDHFENIPNMPSWAETAYINNLFSYKLLYDNLNKIQLIEKLEEEGNKEALNTYLLWVNKIFESKCNLKKKRNKKLVKYLEALFGKFNYDAKLSDLISEHIDGYEKRVMLDCISKIAKKHVDENMKIKDIL